MQLIAPHQEMKMNDVSNGNPSASPNSDTCTPVEADSIVQAFARAFYTTLSKDRTEISKYYGHESFVNFENNNVVGQQEIANFYSIQFPEKVHIKIHSMKGIPTVHQGIAVQVLGAINNRQFVQSFVLGQQSSKKYYVENDIFQYVPDVIKESEHNKTAHNNGHILNGKPEKKQTIETSPIVQAPPTIKTPQKPQTTTPKKVEAKIEKTPQKEQTPTKPVEKPREPVARVPVQKKPVVQQTAPAPAPVPQEPPKPKTWANMVGSGIGKAPASSAPQQQPQQEDPIQQVPTKPHVQQVQHEAQPQQAQKSFREEIGKTPECKIYLGGINRVIVPDSTATAETEIKSLFYNYGEVHDVYMPKKVLDHPNDTSKTAFAFITMRYPAAVKKIFDAATKDEQGQYRLKLKIDAFGFDGTATISEQKDRPFQHGPPGGYRGRGGFQQRGGYQPRGRGSSFGGPGRGGMRGGFGIHQGSN